MANKVIPHSSSTSREITSLRAVHSKASSSHLEAAAVNPPNSTAQLRVARTEEILGSDSVRRYRTVSVYQQVEDQILLPDSDEAGPVLQVGEWIDIDLEMVLDSGACEHVMDSEDAPWYSVLDSPGSRRGQGFVVGNGARVPNEGQVQLNLEMGSEDGTVRDLASISQVAEINRPLMSVSKICDAGLTCVFIIAGADVINAKGVAICRSERKGGL